MPTTLEILRAEREAQQAEEARPPLCGVDSSRVFIANEKPSAADNVTLEWFDEVAQEYESLDVARRNKCIFQLTIRKHRNEQLNSVNYRQGFSYRFEKLQSLKLLYGNPAGSMQICERLHSVPLLPPGFAVVVPEQRSSVNNYAAMAQLLLVQAPLHVQLHRTQPEMQ
ncbi:hypothetical protein PHYPSEUDO_005996 [Phytophthora pseudosyringae]|uniref:Uncharacterized protein n=1 Tax=Phytophthora pseudosyringae TaxID=221518 RepID=A0A8T1VKJ4_9STRA|nr:hypothetical protein PHYPSEUDO_005996 [Phytophthora pseudosyringae]